MQLEKLWRVGDFSAAFTIPFPVLHLKAQFLVPRHCTNTILLKW